MLASSRLDWENEKNRNDGTRNDEGFNDVDFPAFKPNYDRRGHAHHSNFAENNFSYKFSAKSVLNEMKFQKNLFTKFWSIKNEMSSQKMQLSSVFSFKYFITWKNLIMEFLSLYWTPDINRGSRVRKFRRRARCWEGFCRLVVKNLMEHWGLKLGVSSEEYNENLQRLAGLSKKWCLSMTLVFTEWKQELNLTGIKHL